MQAYEGSSPVTTDDGNYCFDASRLSKTQAQLISRSTHSVKLPFFQKATAVIVIVQLVHTEHYENG